MKLAAKTNSNLSDREQGKKRVRSGALARVIPSFFALFALLLPAAGFAAVQITDVMYDVPGTDDGREWVEITNKGGETVDVSKFKFREAGVNHKLTLASGNPTLAPGESAVIASDPTTFLSEHAGFSKSVFKSSFSLSNSGETLALIDASGKEEHSLSYTAPPKPAPTVAPAKKTTSASKAKTTKTKSTSTPKELTYTDGEDLIASAAAASIPPMVGWGAGLAGVIALGTAGALYARLQRKDLESATSNPEDEFDIVEN